jgi:prepilin-type N-terminal cleavage/methylation domain-containing protein
MKKNIIKENKGFTIIEVLIVLAIAGLIMAVVLIAVPGLQRSQANSAAKTDATHIATAVTTWSSNNSGATPAVIGDLYDIYQNVGSLSKFTDGNASSTTTGNGSSTSPAWQVGVSPSAASHGGWYLVTNTAGNTPTQIPQLSASGTPYQWAVVIETAALCTKNPEFGSTAPLSSGDSSNIAIEYTTQTSGQPDWNCEQAQ